MSDAPTPRLDKVKTLNLAQATKLFRELRDKKKQADDAHKLKMSPVNELMTALEARMLEIFQETGQESARTEYGTPYISLRESMSVSDRDAFLEFVQADGAWEFLENRVNKTAVKQYKEEHGELPPGINYTCERVINVKAPTKK